MTRVRTRTALKDLETQRLALQQEISDLKASIEVLTAERDQIQQQMGRRNDDVKNKRHIITDLLVDDDDPETEEAFSRYFGERDLFVEEVRRALYEDD